FPGRNLQSVTAPAVESHAKRGIAAALALALDASRDSHARALRGTKLHVETIERCAGQFEKLIAAFGFDGEVARRKLEILRQLAGLGLLKTVFVERFVGSGDAQCRGT